MGIALKIPSEVRTVAYAPEEKGDAARFRQPAVWKLLAQALLVLWAVAVNILYFYQYHNLVAARFLHWLQRWR